MKPSEILSQCDNVSFLSKGGQKEVYAASHPNYGSVVVKTGQYPNETSLERIRREVELLEELDSEYFPQVYEFLIDQVDSEFAIVEERLEGNILADAGHRFSDQTSILRLLWGITEALGPIWDRQVVHRDLKPANIIIAPDSQPRIIDFGIARFLDSPALTASALMMGPGTPRYAAPEQLNNAQHAIDVRTDLFSLGVICYELSYGHHPFEPSIVEEGGSIPENILNGRLAHATSRERSNEQLERLVIKMIQHQPYQRFRNHHVLRKFIADNWNL